MDSSFQSTSEALPPAEFTQADELFAGLDVSAYLYDLDYRRLDTMVPRSASKHQVAPTAPMALQPSLFGVDGWEDASGTVLGTNANPGWFTDYGASPMRRFLPDNETLPLLKAISSRLDELEKNVAVNRTQLDNVAGTVNAALQAWLNVAHGLGSLAEGVKKSLKEFTKTLLDYAFRHVDNGGA